jgi:hypothetical protein
MPLASSASKANQIVGHCGSPGAILGVATTPFGSKRLGKLGYVKGQNLVVLRLSAKGHQDKNRAVLQQAIDAASYVIWCASSQMLESDHNNHSEP